MWGNNYNDNMEFPSNGTPWNSLEHARSLQHAAVTSYMYPPSQWGWSEQWGNNDDERGLNSVQNSRPNSADPASTARNAAAAATTVSRQVPNNNEKHQNNQKGNKNNNQNNQRQNNPTSKLNPNKKKNVLPEQGNVEVKVNYLINGKLGLNLRGVKVETFGDPQVANFGWHHGDVITALNGKKVNGFEDFSHIFEQAKKKIDTEPIIFTVYRSSVDKNLPHGAPGTFKFGVLCTHLLITQADYICNSLAGVAVRSKPGFISNSYPCRTGDKIEGKQVVTISDCHMGSDQRLYLKLADRDGWIFDDSILVPKNPTVQLVPIEKPLHLQPPVYTGDDPYERLATSLERLRRNYVRMPPPSLVQG